MSVKYQEILAGFSEIVGLGFMPGPVKHDVRHYVSRLQTSVEPTCDQVPFSCVLARREGFRGYLVCAAADRRGRAGVGERWRRRGRLDD